MQFDTRFHSTGICIKFKGAAEVKWSTQDTRRDNAGKTHDITIDHKADEEYFSITYYLLGSKTGEYIFIAIYNCNSKLMMY